jgi:hypothetical protein
MRHLVPLAFVMSLLCTMILSFFSSTFLCLFFMIAGAYVTANLFFSGRIILHTMDIRYLITLPMTFACLHFVYGIGSIWGLLQVARLAPKGAAES